jgi:DNA-binding PadR family transcriptional regulator
MKRFSYSLERRVARSFIDLVILCVLEEVGGLNGNEIVSQIHKKLGILVSSGVVYPALYALERGGFIVAAEQTGSRAYSLSPKGKVRLRELEDIPKIFELFEIKLCREQGES